MQLVNLVIFIRFSPAKKCNCSLVKKPIKLEKKEKCL